MVMHAIIARLALMALCIAGLMAGGCDAIREMTFNRKAQQLHDEYESLNDCERVKFVQRYLMEGKRYDPVLAAYWPPENEMLSMLTDLEGKTGISWDAAMIWSWCAVDHGPDSLWLELIEPWRMALGCDSTPVDRKNLLRWCDPLIVDLHDSLSHALSTGAWPARPEQLAFAQNQSPLLSEFPSIARYLLNQASISDSAGLSVEYCRTCNGLLPGDRDALYTAYLAHLHGDIVVGKIVANQSEHSEYSLRHSIDTADGTAFLLRKNMDGTRLFIIARHPSATR